MRKKHLPVVGFVSSPSWQNQNKGMKGFSIVDVLKRWIAASHYKKMVKPGDITNIYDLANMNQKLPG